MSERDGKCKSVRGRTYEKKKAEVTQSNKFPDASPPKTSAGNPCSLALPKFDLSRTIVYNSYVSGMTSGGNEQTCKKIEQTSNRKDSSIKFSNQLPFLGGCVAIIIL
jgi:hypothetical protein